MEKLDRKLRIPSNSKATEKLEKFKKEYSFDDFISYASKKDFDNSYKIFKLLEDDDKFLKSVSNFVDFTFLMANPNPGFRVAYKRKEEDLNAVETIIKVAKKRNREMLRYVSFGIYEENELLLNSPKGLGIRQMLVAFMRGADINARSSRAGKHLIHNIIQENQFPFLNFLYTYFKHEIEWNAADSSGNYFIDYALFNRTNHISKFLFDKFLVDPFSLYKGQPAFRNPSSFSSKEMRKYLKNWERAIEKSNTIEELISLLKPESEDIKENIMLLLRSTSSIKFFSSTCSPILSKVITSFQASS